MSSPTLYHGVRTEQPSRTLREELIEYICTNIRDFDSGTLSKIPDTCKQELLERLSRSQSISLSVLKRFSDSQVTRINLSYCGRVTNEWAKTLRDFPLTQLNLSHCLITDEALSFMKNKTIYSSVKKVSLEEEVEPSQKKGKSKGKGKEKKDKSVLSTSPSQIKTFKAMVPWRISNLTNLNLSFIGSLSNVGLETVANTFVFLKLLALEGCPKVNNESLAIVARMTQLTALNIRGCQKISNKGVCEIKRLVNLEVLNLSSLPKVTSDSLNFIFPELEKLIYVNLQNNDKVNGMNSLECLPNLRTIDLSGLEFDSLAFLSKNVLLHSLILSKSNVDDEDLAHLNGFEAMRTLDLSSCKQITSKAICTLVKNMNDLVEVDLSYTQCNSEVLKILSGFKIISLNIRGCESVLDSGFEHIGSMPRLTSLNVSLLKHITVGWNFLSTGKYKMLDIGGCMLKENIEYFYGVIIASNGLEALYLTDNVMNDKFCGLISKLKLKWLDLSHTTLNETQLKVIVDIKTLETLSLRDCTECGSNDFGICSNLTRLVFLDVSNTGFSDTDLEDVVACSELRNLSLMNCKSITDHGMINLTHLPNLTNLNLYQVTLTDSGVDQLQKLVNVSTLRLSLWDLISDKGFDSLHQLSNLVYLKTNQLEGSMLN